MAPRIEDCTAKGLNDVRALFNPVELALVSVVITGRNKAVTGGCGVA